MKLNKMFLVGALLSLGFASCSKEGNGPDPDNAAKSYMSMTLSMPMGSARAGDGQDQANPDYHYVGEWAGKDKIEKVSIYMVPQGGPGLVESAEDLDFGTYYENPTIDPATHKIGRAHV